MSIAQDQRSSQQAFRLLDVLLLVCLRSLALSRSAIACR